MRTTLTIEADVAFGLKHIQKSEPEKPFKLVVNEVLRRGLERCVKKNKMTTFKVRAQPMGLHKDLNFDNIEEVLDILEGVNRR